jgi:pimeloyl-ACP methyl ester carboxylesterase
MVDVNRSTTPFFAEWIASVENDMTPFAALPDLPVDKIQCPALIVHNTHDNDVPFYHGVYAWENIANAEKHWVPEVSHFCAWVPPEAKTVQGKLVQFLKRWD